MVGLHLRALKDLPLSDMVIRFAFGAALSAVAAVLSIVLGVRPGGLLLAFPGILPATLTFIEKQESEHKAEDTDIGAIFGAAALVGFAFVVWQYLPAHPAPLVLLGATADWFVAAVLLYLGFRLVLRKEHPLSKVFGDPPPRAGRQP
jgi:uncharacterized membrane protein (GlpM family)